MSDNETTDTPPPTDQTDESGAAPTDESSKPHGDEGTDWKSEARKWEQRAKENYEKAQSFDEFQDAQKTEAQKAQEAREAAEKRAADAERQLLVLQVAADKGLTPAQAKRLTGDSREELEADADELLELLTPPEQDPPPGGRPKRLVNGNDPDPSKGGFDPEALAAKIFERSNF